MIYILIGLPRSGKSSVVNSLLKPYYSKEDFVSKYFYRHDRKNPDDAITLSNRRPFSVICADDIRLAMTGQRYYGPSEPLVHSIKHTMIRAMLLKNQDILIDETHSSDISISELLKITPDVYGRFIATHPDECKKRAIECGQNDLVDNGVIDRMVNNFKKMNPVYRDMFGIKADWI